MPSATPPETSPSSAGPDPDSIDWTVAPQYVRGVLCLLLPGESAISDDEARRRVGLYCAQRRAQMRVAAEEAALRPYFADSLARVREVFVPGFGDYLREQLAPPEASVDDRPLGPDATADLNAITDAQL